MACCERPAPDAQRLDLHLPRDRETVITPSLTLRNAGGTTPEPNTVVCPTSIVNSFDVYMAGGDVVGDFSGALVPVFMDGGSGDDTLTGGESDDTFQWYPYSSSDDDTIEGGPGSDTLDMHGSYEGETYTIAKEGADGFRLHRDVDDGLDTISTVSLPKTEQHVAGGPFGSPTTLTADADGRCLVREGDMLTTPGRPPIAFSGVETVDVTNHTCPRTPAPCPRRRAAP